MRLLDRVVKALPLAHKRRVNRLLRKVRLVAPATKRVRTKTLAKNAPVVNL